MGVPRPDVGERIHRRGLTHGDIVAKRAEIRPGPLGACSRIGRVIAATLWAKSGPADRSSNLTTYRRASRLTQ